MSADPFHLERFVTAQQPLYAQALRELQDGLKRSHWMWFIFPQIQGLGSSPTAQHFAISGKAEAEAYLQHPILGPRLHECAAALLTDSNKSAHDILGSPDDLKLRSSATLFAEISSAGSVFHQVLERFYHSFPDPKTLALLR